MVRRESDKEIEESVSESLWYLAEEGSVFRGVETLMKHFADKQSARRDKMLLHERMYGGRKMVGLGPTEYWRTEESFVSDAKRLRYNIVKSCIDALGAEIAQHKPRPLYLTKKGSTKLKKKAEKRTKYVEGQFHKCRVYELMQWAAFDGFRVGTGVLKVWNDGHELHLDRVHPGELFVVDAETIYGKTLQLFHVKYLARTEVAALPCVDTPEKKALVKACKPEGGDTRATGLSDIIRVVESYRLPIKRGKKVVVKGRHTITLQNGDLMDREWKRERFPYAFYRYQRAAFGFWGTGVAEQLEPDQYEINKMLQIIQEAVAFCSAPWVLTEGGGPNGNKVNVKHLRNEAGAVIDGGMGKVSVYTPNPIHPIMLQLVDTRVAAAFEKVGVSRAAAQQQSQLGADASGAAQREEHDRYSRRFIIQHQQFDQFALDIAEIIVDEVEELAGKHGGMLPIDVPVGDGIEKVDWAEAGSGEEMVLKCYPTNFFSTTPASKKQEVIDAIRNGWLSKEQGMKQLDFPDVASESALTTAYIDHVDRIAGLILDDEQKVKTLPKIKGFWPEPFDLRALQTMSDRMNRWLKRSQANDDTEEPRLDLMREWITRAEATIKKAMPPAPVAPAPMAQAA